MEQGCLHRAHRKTPLYCYGKGSWATQKGENGEHRCMASSTILCRVGELSELVPQARELLSEGQIMGNKG